MERKGPVSQQLLALSKGREPHVVVTPQSLRGKENWLCFLPTSSFQPLTPKPFCCPNSHVSLGWASMTNWLSQYSQSHYALASTPILTSVLIEVDFKYFHGEKKKISGGKMGEVRGHECKRKVRSPLGNLQSWVQTGARECCQAITPSILFLFFL